VEPTHATDAVGIITIVIQLIFLEGILSIDNAAVLGAMVSVLPTDQPVPYPGPLKIFQGFTNRYLGMQQSAALKVGLLGAYLGRALMLVLASWVIANPFLKILGAAYLIKLAFENLGKFAEHGAEAEGEDGEVTKLKRAGEVSFWGVVLNVELADLAFSLDNVVAAVALSDQLWVVMVGVALGIITMRFAATAFTWMIKREPILEQAAYIIVFNIGLELILVEFGLVEHIEAWQKFVISIGTIVLCIVYAHVPALHVLRPILYWLADGMRLVNELIEWVFHPVVAIFKGLFHLVKKLMPASKGEDDSVVAPVERAVAQAERAD
jgi:tellurite resistance protein TerC